MKKSVAITAVLALHIGVISMLLVQAGCSSEPEAPAAKAKTATEEVTTIAPAEQKEADASVRDAELPPEGSPALRVADCTYNADQIIVVDHGRIAERGTHAELMERNGIYAKLIEMQSFD